MKAYFSRPKFWQRLLSFLICVLMLVCTVAAMLVADIRIATNKENTSAIIQQALFSNHTLRLPSVSGNGSSVSVVRTQPKLAMVRLEEASDDAVTDAMIEMIYGMIEEQAGGEIDVTLEEVKEFVDESTFGDFVADTSASLISDLITGENTTTIDEETITALLTENAPLIQEYFDISLDEQAIAEITSAVVENEYVAELQENGVTGLIANNKELSDMLGLPPVYNESTDTNTGSGTSSGLDAITGLSPDSSIADYLAAARAITSAAALYSCIGAVAVLILLLCLLNRKHIWFAIRGTGRTFIIASLPMAVLTLSYQNDPASWKTLFSAIPEVGTMIGKVLGLILQLTAPVNLSVFYVGLALAILGTVLKIVAKSKAKRRYAAEEAEKAAAAAVAVDEPAEETQEALPEQTAEEEAPATEDVADDAPAAETVEEAPTEEIKEEAPVE